MEVRHLELLRDLRQRGTLAAVAAATYRTTSALSQQVRTAEREVGVTLVEPDGRGLRLTWAGELLADGADEVVAALARVQARLDAAKGEPAGTVRIGTLPSAGTALLPPVFEQFAGTLVTIDIDDFDVAEIDFAARSLDCDLVIGHSMTADVPSGAEGLITRVLAREPLDIAVPAAHPLAARAALTPADVIGEPWITVPQGYPFAAIVTSIEAVMGAAVRRVAHVKDNRLVEALVAGGHGVAVLPRFSTPSSSRFTLVPLEGVPAMRRIVLMARQDRLERHVTATVADALVRVGRQLA